MHLQKYHYKIVYIFDFICYILTYPWLVMLSLFLSCFWSTTEELKTPSIKFVHYLIYAPILALFELFVFPFAAFGYFFWIVTCQLFHIPDFAVLDLSSGGENEDSTLKKNFFTFCSGNLLLGPDTIGKFQNMPFVYSRLAKITESFSKINTNDPDPPEPICNDPILNDPTIPDEELMDTVVSDKWPQLDFMCFQEVFDRYFTYKLVKSLYPQFKHFVVDVAKHSWSSNLYWGTSGLMIASRYPILEADFYVCKHKRSLWSRPICYGIIMAKVDLLHRGQVGYISNLHNVAYQGLEDLISPFLSEAQAQFNQFRKKTLKRGEKEAFAVVCGDFNFDNISPGDGPMQKHALFGQFSDFCMQTIGQDKGWAVGTELRQLNIYEAELRSAKSMKNMMVDHIKRRYFIIDADVAEQTFDLMVCQPKPDEDGEVRPKPFGGRRRIDRILVDTKECQSKVEGYQFLTCLAGQTDHVPVALTIKC